MLKGYKIRIKPTIEQESLLWKTANTSRWVHNHVTWKILNEESTLNESNMRKYFTKLKKLEDYKWLNEVGNTAIKNSIINLYKGWRITKKRPVFWKKNRHKPSFCVNYESFRRTGKYSFREEKLGNVTTTEKIPKLPNGCKHYSNPVISYDNKYWYISFSIKVVEKGSNKSGSVLGIDLGIKDLAIVSNTNGHVKTYKNINKTNEIRRLKKKLIRKQRSLARKYENAKREHLDIRDLKNYRKVTKEVQLIYRRLTNIRTNYLHQTTTELVKTTPKIIVMEDLNVSGMMKNRHLSRAISEQKFYELRRMLEYKCKVSGIELKIADRFYPSSKTCSSCGCIKKKLSLKERTYRCEHCSAVMDRDINASINLAKLG